MAGALTIAWLLLPAPVAATPGSLLALVDDRGEPLASAVELCFVEGLGTDCVERPAGAGPVALPAFDLLRVEGPEHGPVAVRERDLPAAEEGVRRLAVPRKATLRVRGGSDHRLTAALHSVEDLDPTRPAHSLAVPPGGGLKVPAGDWLLALESRGAAPDLHALAALPGSSHTVLYRPRAGWSLVVRAVAKEDEAPVAGVRLSVQPVKERSHGQDEDREEPRTAESGAHGLALLSGLEAPVVDAELHHPDFVTTALPGVSSTSGALELREAALGKGATLEAAILVDGEPAAGWRCALLDRTPPNYGTSREVAAMDAGAEGVCRGEKLPEGFFWLRVSSPEEGAAAAEREVQLYDGEASILDLDLSPIRVEGAALRGQEPVAGYAVRIYRLSETGSTQLAEPVAETVTDEDGAYEATIWDAGVHSVHLAGPDGRSADSEQADLQPPETRVDFHLAPADVEGIVVDEDGEPVATASVRVVWEVADGRSMSSLRAGEDGTFRLPLEARAGTLAITAEHPGFRPDTARFTLAEDALPPPVVLTLRRGGLLQGRVLTAGGAPVAGVVVQSFALGPRGGLERRASARTGAEGRFEILPAERPPTRLFATGPGCALTVADVEEASEPVLLTCPQAAATLLVRLQDEAGRPVTGEFLLLRRGEVVIPVGVLLAHLSFLGQSTTSDGSGRLVVPGLPTGTYDVFLLRQSSEEMAVQGRPEGHLGTATLLPGQTAELEAVVDVGR